MTIKKCSKCKTNKSLIAFYRDSTKVSKQNDGYSSWCKECTRTARMARYQKDTVKIRKNELRYRYNISEEEYSSLIKMANGECMICHKIPTIPKQRQNKLCIDHDHTTGKIRGLLCNLCNKGLGLFGDNPDLLNNAAKYLIQHRKQPLD